MRRPVEKGVVIAGKDASRGRRVYAPVNGLIVEVVNGAVSKTQRDIIFNKFQKTRDPHVLVADARTMSHGLTLTEASTVIWYAPAPSNNVYEQANGRITRSGQKHSMNIINISASPMERRIYKRHQNQQSSQGVLLDLVKESMTGGV